MLLEEQIGDQINKNTSSTLVIRGINHKNSQKTLSSTLCGYSGWNKDQFTYDTNRVCRGTYKNPKLTNICQFYVMESRQNITASIISANRADKLNIFGSQRYSKKIQDKMNS